MKFLILLVASLFAEANQHYADGNYDAAANDYEQILTQAQAQQSALPRDYAPVYYNLGNARFRQGELAQSILAYERCLRLDPTMRDAEYNLRFAQSRITDNINDNQAFFLSTFLINVRNRMKESTWMWLSIGMFVLFLIGTLAFLLSRATWLRKTTFYVAIVALLVSIAALCNTSSLHRRDNMREEAIITQGIVNAKASPDKSGTELFTLHEGTKVRITETLGQWSNISVGNHEGWILTQYLERI